MRFGGHFGYSEVGHSQLESKHRGLSSSVLHIQSEKRNPFRTEQESMLTSKAESRFF